MSNKGPCKMDSVRQVSCPDCGTALTPAGGGLPPLVCEACGWPPVVQHSS